MALHEIGYLVIGGVFKCWLAGTDLTCLGEKAVNPPNTPFEKIEDYINRDIHYEVGGLAVFDKKGDVVEVRKKSGEKISLSVSHLKSSSAALLAKNKESVYDDGYEDWKYESLESILKGTILRDEFDYLPHLKKEDLKTSVMIPKSKLEEVRKNKIARIVSEDEIVPPIAYIEVPLSCKYKEVQKQQFERQCEVPKKASAFAQPDVKSKKLMDALFSWEHMEGRVNNYKGQMPAILTSRLVIYEENESWVKMGAVKDGGLAGSVWIQKTELPSKIVNIPLKDRLEVLINFTAPSHEIFAVRESSRLREVESLVRGHIELGIGSANETKWLDGVLWLKVNIFDEPACGGDQTILGTGWVPYMVWPQFSGVVIMRLLIV